LDDDAITSKSKTRKLIQQAFNCWWGVGVFSIFAVACLVVGYEHVGVFMIGGARSFYGFCCG
jgi:hypothetical protein